jgi:hypothetical protein
VRAKTRKKPSRPIQYLLSADRKLRRLSLRRIPARAKTARSLRQPARWPATRRLHSDLLFPAAIGTSMVLTVIGVIAAGVLIAARQPLRATEIVSATPQVPVSAPARRIAPAPQAIATPMATTPVVPAAAAAGGPITPAATAVAHAAPTATAHAPAAAAARAPAPESTAAAPEINPTPTAATSEPNSVVPVTIAGCLERDETSFRLKDTAGADAPKSRSWRSGFLRKRSAPIRIVDATNTLKLPAHIGQRVSATGTLVDGEMHARGLQSVSASCR